MDPQKQRAFGVFKPIGHIVASFPNSNLAQQGKNELEVLGIASADIHSYTDTEMLAQIDADLDRASPLAGVGQELNLIKAHRVLAEHGYHWLVIRVIDDSQARLIAGKLCTSGAERAQLYGRFMIEELISHPTDLPQVKDSPDSGLDALTPSGTEEERALIRPKGGQ
ncbi:hypothetical protein [Comamonas avium]|uniref:Uncharacterized protein n=1 Tax=Comamonas avium TaxID=2762231 RepID=A0ABR8S7B2_9BURK|nr:hypothetical protein [Comamonas avium]MBD7959358.1 hypothetical protein [Comamonas avium]